VRLLFLAAAIPGLFWDKGPETADQLKQAGIARAIVPASREAEWKSTAISVRAGDTQGAVRLATPAASFRANEASATRSPWLVTNGWRILRQPQARYYYDAGGSASALAAAEAYAFGADAMISTDVAGLGPLGAMLAFLDGLKPFDAPAVADIGYIDDGSTASAEVINMLIRRNLLVKLVKTPEPRLGLNIEFGSPQYSKADAVDPGRMAQKIRAELGDARRSLRIYGSDVVVGRLAAAGGRARVHLLNYGNRVVNGVRVRIAGRYSKHQAWIAGVTGVLAADLVVESAATEFTVPELRTYAVIDLSR
jgi:hypothetical protein